MIKAAVTVALDDFDENRVNHIHAYLYGSLIVKVVNDCMVQSSVHDRHVYRELL